MRTLLLALLLTTGLALSAAPATAEVTWLCNPGLANDPCQLPQDTTIRSLDGTENVETPEAEGEPKIDCFYVYPTVSQQVAANATKAKDPEVRSIASYQAARFNQQCRIFAPVYRQATLASIGLGAASPADRQIPYEDVREAWREYLAKGNEGRGVVLIGHSQGSFVLRRLIREEIEPKPEQLRRVVSSLLIGGNVTVPPGKLVGGDFKTTPLCTSRVQLQCVVAYSTFAETPPADARFGRTSERQPDGSPLSVACTDPRPLAGTDAPFRVLVPSQPFAPGVIAAGIVLVNVGPPPTAPTTWVIPPDRYTGGCRTDNGVNVLRLDRTPGSKQPGFFPDPTWSTHLVDVNATYEPLVSLVAQQAKRWTEPDLRLTRRCVGQGRLRVRLEGPDAELVRDVNFKLGKRLAARDTAGRFEKTVRPRDLARTRSKELRAVAYLTAGPPRVIAERSLPRCGVR
ncbi:MAG: DUF3089 domain-containing protein [Solirubrobacterales bacterium]|nr:DUF3089 domain-containing protein [Solirubrobacterales bacterium]